MENFSDADISAILSCIAYDDKIMNYFETNNAKDLFDFASNKIDSFGKLRDPDNVPALMPKEEYEAILRTIVNNPDTFENLVIQSVDNPGGWGRAITVTNGSQVYLVYEGTADGAQWYDDAYGAGINITDTPAQKAAIEYATSIKNKGYLDGKELIITGHSKGGNLAGYVSVVGGFNLAHCYAFDAQGYSKAFLDKYREQLLQIKDSLTLIAHEKDAVSAMLAGIWGALFYVKSDGNHISIVSGHIPSSLFSFDGADVHLMEFQAGRSFFNESFASMFSYLSVVLREDDFEYIAAQLVNIIGGGGIEQYHGLPPMPDGFAGRVIPILLSYAKNNPEIYVAVMQALLPEILGVLKDHPEFLVLFASFPVLKGFLEASGVVVSGILGLVATFSQGAYYSNKIRDFSERHRQEILYSLGSVGSDEWWDLTTTDLYYRVSKLTDLSGSTSFNEYFANLSTLFISSYDQINTIFDNACAEDARFGSHLSSTFVPLLETLETQIRGLAERFASV